MKRTTIAGAVVVVVLLALLATPVLAQPGPHGRGHRHFAHHHGLGELFSRLDLTEEQQADIDALMSRHRETMKELVQQTRARHLALAELIHADTIDEGAIRQAASDLGEAEGDVALERANMLRDVRQVLTAEQWERAREMFRKHREAMNEGRGWGGRRFHGHGPRPGFGPGGD